MAKDKLTFREDGITGRDGIFYAVERGYKIVSLHEDENGDYAKATREGTEYVINFITAGGTITYQQIFR